MPGKWPDQTLDQAFGLPEGAGRRPHLASVFQGNRKSANIHTSSGVIWRMSVHIPDRRRGGHLAARIWASSQFRKRLPSTSVQGSSGESQIMAIMSVQNKAEGDVDKYVRKKFFPTQNTGVFVDVGAASPNYLSNSALYRSLGWTVIAVEANPVFCELHRKLGHEVVQCACGDHDEDGVDFSVVDSHGAQYENGQVSYEQFSSLAIKDTYKSLNADLDLKKIKVNLRRLDTILATRTPHINHIDILSVDVEGWELEVIAGLNLEKYKPRVMVIENLFDDEKYRVHLGSKGYLLWKILPPNDVYVRAGFWMRLFNVRAGFWMRLFRKSVQFAKSRLPVRLKKLLRRAITDRQK
jgi:FkbM family methyltransferase